MNMQQLMRQAQQMQKQMKENQAKMEVTDFEGSAGNGVVRIVISGTYVVKSVKINPEVVDKNDVELIQDMIVVAINDAKKKVDDANKNSLGTMGSALNSLI